MVPPLSRPQPVFSFPKRLSLRVTSEFDSEESIFLHKISTKFFDSLAKLKFSVKNNSKGEICQPQLAFTSKHLSIDYDVKEKNAVVMSSFDVGPRLHFDVAHDTKDKRVEVAVLADLADPGYKLQFWSPVPFVGLPTTTFKFPIGEILLGQRKEKGEKRILSLFAWAEGQIWNGICIAHYKKEEEMKLKYTHKDDEMSFIPTISLPSKAVSFAFKRRFSPSDKVSYWYNFDSNFWSAVYKHTYGKDFKFKAGYDSKLHLSWASLWDSYIPISGRQRKGQGKNSANEDESPVYDPSATR